MTEQPALTYAGTSGWSGSDASRERVYRDDRSGRTAGVQHEVLSTALRHGSIGVTIAELRDYFPQHHHGSLSSALTNLHRDGRLARLVEQRNRCSIYVVPDAVNGRECRAAGRVPGGKDKAGAQDQPAAQSPQTADLGIAEWVYAAEMTEAFEQGFGLGHDNGWQVGYDQGVEAAQKRPGAVLDAKHEGVLAGRQQQAARTMALVSQMREAMKGRGPVEAHTTTCWMRHPQCALDAVAKAQAVEAVEGRLTR
jgi:hypothetical protein